MRSIQVILACFALFFEYSAGRPFSAFLAANTEASTDSAMIDKTTISEPNEWRIVQSGSEIMAFCVDRIALENGKEPR